MKAENLRNPKMVLHIPIAPSKLELLASKRNRAFFLGHPVFSQVSAIFQRDGANIPSPLLEPPTWVRFSKNIFGGFSFMLWLGALLCFAHYSIQVIFA